MLPGAAQRSPLQPQPGADPAGADRCGTGPGRVGLPAFVDASDPVTSGSSPTASTPSTESSVQLHSKFEEIITQAKPADVTYEAVSFKAESDPPQEWK